MWTFSLSLMKLTFVFLVLKLHDYQDDAPQTNKDSSSPDGKRTVDFNSPIWQKTPIAAVTEIKENSKDKEVRFSKCNIQNNSQIFRKYQVFHAVSVNGYHFFEACFVVYVNTC